MVWRQATGVDRRLYVVLESTGNLRPGREHTEVAAHAKVGTTLDIYSHVTPGLQQAAVLRFDEGLTAASTRGANAEPIPG